MPELGRKARHLTAVCALLCALLAAWFQLADLEMGKDTQGEFMRMWVEPARGRLEGMVREAYCCGCHQSPSLSPMGRPPGRPQWGQSPLPPPASLLYPAKPLDMGRGVTLCGYQHLLKPGHIGRCSQAGIHSLVSPSPQNGVVSGLVRGLCTYIHKPADWKAIFQINTSQRSISGCNKTQASGCDFILKL